jgi:RNA polymerase sigma factor (sigma-70 family)
VVATESVQTLVRHIRRLAASGSEGASDCALVQRFALQRDELAFEALVRRHGPMVLGVCRRILRVEHDAEDAFQATFLVLARKAAFLRRQESVGNWLYGVATRVALRSRTDAARRRQRERDGSGKQPADPLTELTVREAQQILDEEIQQLPAKYRATLVLCCLEGLARDEAAQQLQCPEATLKSRLERARALLRTRLARRGLTLPAALVGTLLTDRVGQAVAPALLAKTTVQAVTASTPHALDGSVSAAVVALAEGASYSAWKTKLLLAVLLIALSSLGAGFAVWQDSGAPQSTNETGDPGSKREAAVPAPAASASPLPREAAPPLRALSRTPASLMTWKPRATLPGQKRPVRALEFTPEGAYLVSAGDEGRVRVWDVAQAKERLTLHAPQEVPISALVLTDGGTVVTAGRQDGVMLRWDLREGATPATLSQDRNQPIRALRGSGGNLLWMRGDGVVARREGSTIPGRPGEVDCVAMSPDGRQAAWGMHDGSVRLWDTAAKKERGHFPVHRHQVWCVTFAPDGRTLASADHFGAVAVWNAADGQQRMLGQDCKGGSHVLALAFSADAGVIASAGLNRQIQLWDTTTGQKLAELGERQDVQALAFSPCGRFLAAAGFDGTIRIWASVPPASLPPDRPDQRRQSGGSVK